MTAFATLTAFAPAFPPLRAQDIAGTWQGTMQAGQGTTAQGTTKDQRIVLKIVKSAGGTWQGVVYSLDSDMAFEGRATTQMNLQGGDLRFAIAPVDTTYLGKLSEDGATLAGTWTQSGATHPLNLARVMGDAAWEIPRPDAPMARDADPDWDVVTVKARDPNDTGNDQSMGMKGRQFVIVNRPVEGMLLFAYGMHKKQVVGLPEWARTERWDIRGVPDVPGSPSLKQAQSLTRKLLEERFGLKVHRETRELAVYAITVAKGGEKMAPSAGDPNGTPDENERSNGGQITMRMTNMSMAELAPDLGYFLDRPAVDRTGLAGRYDIQLIWTADESQAPTEGNAPPGLFTAIQEQIGLKLEPVKAETGVLVVDAVERPSAN
ncbi:MAG: TIGR03435 family protein [Terracidiphilus sp.]|nr:TIGR03435 family protein [Terracidiphilus sp.]